MKQIETIEVPEDLVKQQFDRDLANKKDELERGIKNLEQHQYVLTQQREVLETLRKARPVILENLVIVRPFYKYEESPEFTAFNKAQEQLKFTQLEFDLAERAIPTMEKTIDAKEKTIAHLKTVIAEMEESKND